MRRVEQPNELKLAVTGKKAVVLFHSTWCPYCRAFRPLFEEATKRGSLEAVEAVIDDDDNPLWEQHRIGVVPTVLFFDGEKVVRRLDGRSGVGLEKADLLDALKAATEMR